MRSKVRGDAREWIAADLSVRLADVPSDEQTAALAVLLEQGVVQTAVLELHGMVSSTQVPDSALVFVKVVDPSLYPLYGTVQLRPPAPLSESLRDDSVVVSRNLAEELNVKAGDFVRIGGIEFRMAAEIVAEPDWFVGLSTALPRILLTPAGLARSGLGLQGDVTRKLLFRIREGQLEAVRRRLEEAFPDAGVEDYRDPDPGAAVTFDEAAVYFEAAAWMTLAFASLAVAMVFHLHIRRRLDTVAVMKVLGARSRQILAVYTIQALGLAVAGGALGALVSWPLQRGICALALGVIPVPLTPRWEWRDMAIAIAAGILATAPSVAGPVWRLRRVSPLLVLRRCTPVPRSSVGWRRLSAFLRPLPLPMRMAARNVSRPGGHSAAMVLALAGGVTMLTATSICQRQIRDKLLLSVPAHGSNLYLISVGKHELDDATEWLASQPGVEGRPTAYPLITLRLDRINGVAVPVHSATFPRMWLATCSDEKARGEIVPSAAGSVLRLKAGDVMEFSSKGHTIRRRVANRTADYLDEAISLLTFPCGDFEALPVYYHAAVRIQPARESAIRRALSARYPGLPTLSRAEFTNLVGNVAGEAATMVQFMSWFVMAIGVAMGTLLIAMGKSLRLEEIAVAKALGARPRLLRCIFLCEFGLVGFFAGVAGALLGTALASMLLSGLLHQGTFAFDAEPMLLAVVVTTVFGAAAGSLLGESMMRRKPMEILREPG